MNLTKTYASTPSIKNLINPTNVKAINPGNKRYKKIKQSVIIPTNLINPPYIKDKLGKKNVSILFLLIIIKFMNLSNTKKELIKVFKDGISTTYTLLKIMIPVSIITKILEITGVINIIGSLLSPLMEIVNLPGEYGLVWATTMITNIYGGIIVFLSLFKNHPLSVAQVTILSSMMLIAHTFLIENTICKKAGIKFWVISFFRFTSAFILGFLLNNVYTLFSLHEKKAKVLFDSNSKTGETTIAWILNEIENYLYIFLVILSLLLIIYIFKKTGFINIFNKIFNPVLKLFGISKKATPLTVIGMTLGLAYGGGLIIKEANSGHLSKKDIFFSLIFLTLSHSLIEDTLLMLTIGASITGVLIGRLLFTLILVSLIVKIFQGVSEKSFHKYFLN